MKKEQTPTPTRLEINVKTNGHNYTLLRRSDTVAVYKQFDTAGGDLVAYELFKIPVRKAETIKGVYYPLREVFPSSSNWGISAWSLPIWTSEQEVLTRFEELTKQQQHGKPGH